MYQRVSGIRCEQHLHSGAAGDVRDFCLVGSYAGKSGHLSCMAILFKKQIILSGYIFARFVVIFAATGECFGKGVLSIC